MIKIILGFFAGVFIVFVVNAISDVRTRRTESLENRLEIAERRLSVIDAQVKPISTVFQEMLVKQLTHFHTPEMDKLLSRLGPPYALTTEEEERLKVLLKQRTKDMGEQITESERDAAIMLPYVMARVKKETQEMLRVPPASPELKVVYVPSESEK